MENKGKKKVFVSVAELAKMLGVSRIAVFKKIKKGQIPAQKIGHSYAILTEDVSNLIGGSSLDVLTEGRKTEINEAVKKVVKEYGETLKLLGKE